MAVPLSERGAWAIQRERDEFRSVRITIQRRRGAFCSSGIRMEKRARRYPHRSGARFVACTTRQFACLGPFAAHQTPPAPSGGRFIADEGAAWSLRAAIQSGQDAGATLQTAMGTGQDASGSLRTAIGTEETLVKTFRTAIESGRETTQSVNLRPQTIGKRVSRLRTALRYASLSAD
jgi:hypothetical protein